MEADSRTHWLPLESNPEVWVEYIRELGVGAPWGFADVYGLDPELLAMTPQPVLAALLLFPTSGESVGADGEVDLHGGVLDRDTDLFFMKQTVGNACGTVGILHAAIANEKTVQPNAGSPLAEFIMETRSKSYLERARMLEGSSRIMACHSKAGSDGQTSAPPAEADVDLHFVAFVHHNGSLYELDGRRDAPIRHGPATADTVLQAAAKVISRLIDENPTDNNFNVIAFCKEEEA